MPGFVRRGWGQGAQQKPAGAPQDDRWSLNAKFAQYTDKGNLVFKLSGFKYEDIEKVNKIKPDVFKILKNEKTGSICLIVKPTALEDFKNILPTLVDELRKFNHYNDKSLDEFEEKILSIIEKTPTQEELAANEKTVISNWKQLLETLNDPETKKKFLAFQTTYICQNSFSDAALSPSNVVEVRLADPQASFVTDAATWKNRFNRVVTPGSPFVIITKPEQSIPPIKLLEADPVVRGKGGWNKLCKDSGGPWYGEAWAAIKRVRIKNNLRTTYYKSKVYDVRFTQPIDPNNDPFLKVANLVNNLTGELNQVAKEMMMKNAALTGQEKPDFEAKKEGLQTSDELMKYKQYILAKCKSKKIDIPEVGSDNEIIASAIYAYAYKIAEEYNVLSPKAKGAFASAVLYSVAYSIGLESSKVSQAADIFGKISPEEGEELIQKTFEIYKQLATHQVNESMGNGIMSFEQYHELMSKLLPNKDTIKQRFDEMNDRLNNVEF